MIIKEKPEDFYVKEIIEFPKEGYEYVYFLMWKRNITTLRAIKIVRKKLGVSRKRISFAGEKDKRAVTEQYISIKGLKDFKYFYDFGNVKLYYVGTFSEPVSTNLLKGNYFRIVVRDVKEDEKKRFYENLDIPCPNYFDEQRFGDIRCINHLVGKAIIKRNFEEAVKIILCYTSEKENPKATEARKWLLENWGNWREALKKFPKYLDIETPLINYLIHHPNDWIGALRKLHIKLLRLFVNSYQSYLFNLALSEIIKRYKHVELEFPFGRLAFPKKRIENFEMPIVGYGTVLEGEIGEIYKKILEKEGISLDDFYIKEIPEISAFGDYRKAFFEPKDFKFEDKGNNFILEFFLEKGCYATILIKFLFLV